MPLPWSSWYLWECPVLLEYKAHHSGYKRVGRFSVTFNPSYNICGSTKTHGHRFMGDKYFNYEIIITPTWTIHNLLNRGYISLKTANKKIMEYCTIVLCRGHEKGKNSLGQTERKVTNILLEHFVWYFHLCLFVYVIFLGVKTPLDLHL